MAPLLASRVPAARPPRHSPVGLRVRRGTVFAVTVAIGLAGLSAPAPAQTATATATQPAPAAQPVLTPTQYVASALDFIEQVAFRKNAVDWASIRAAAERKASTAPTIDAAYPAIMSAVNALEDRHSSFTKPIQAEKQTSGNALGFGFVATWPNGIVASIVAGSPAEKAGLLVGDRVERVDGRLPKHNGRLIVIGRDKNGDLPPKVTLTISRKGQRNRKTVVLRLGDVTLVGVPQAAGVQRPTSTGAVGDYGVVEVPGIVGDLAAQTKYATEIQAALRSAEPTPRCGWIVDLRRNRGGYIYAMLAGIGPLLGPGQFGGQLDANGKRTLWSYRDGAALVDERPTIVADRPYEPAVPDAPVAVLLSTLTASAGEATAIAFRGRANTRFFGEPTAGLTTFNVRKVMPDGAFLDVVNAVDIDRNGTAYGKNLAPDEQIKIDWSNINTDGDPVRNAALDWLGRQTSCNKAA